jgi:hypothetical protein
MSGAQASDLWASSAISTPIYCENPTVIAQESIMGGKGLYSGYSLSAQKGRFLVNLIPAIGKPLPARETFIPNKCLLTLATQRVLAQYGNAKVKPIETNSGRIGSCC